MEATAKKKKALSSRCKPLFPHPAMLIEEKGQRYLALADLHIGFEDMFSTLGYRVEASIEKMLHELQVILEKAKPDQLIILGDVKYSVAAITISEWRNVPRFLEKASSIVKTRLIAGNHDGAIEPLLPRSVEFIGPQGLTIGENHLMHGHTLPPPDSWSAKRFIIGHLHPTYKRRGTFFRKPLWVFLRAKKELLFHDAKEEDVEVVVIPSFNRDLYLTTDLKPQATLGEGGYRAKEISPVIKRIRTGLDKVVATDLEGNVLGGEESLEYIL